MKCKFCEAQWDDDTTVCPVCGMDNSEEPVDETIERAPAAEDGKDDGKMGPGRIALLVVLAVATVAVIVALILSTMNPPEKTDPTDNDTPTQAVSDGDPDSVGYKSSYTVSDEELLSASDRVVATMGDVSLTNQQLQVYYWMTFFDFMNSYGSYASYFGLDTTQPLDEQECPEGGTWQQYFLSNAITTWHQFQSLALCAAEENFTLTAEEQETIDRIPEDMKETAAANGYDSVEDLLLYSMGPGVTIDNYKQYIYNYQLGYLYFESKYNEIQLTDSEISDYFDAHAEDFAANEITKDDSVRGVDVRHVLIQPADGVTDDDGNTTYTSAAWDACKLEAEQLLEAWQSGEHSEDTFAQLAIDRSEDPGSASNGGLYTNVQVGDMVEEFENWCFDASRKTGDTGLVKTSYGYHIMYFVDSSPVWYTQAKSSLLSERSSQIIADSVAKYPITVSYPDIVVGVLPEAPASEAE